MTRSRATTIGSPDNASRETRRPDHLNPRTFRKRGLASASRRQPRDRARTRDAADVTAFLIDWMVPAVAAILPRHPASTSAPDS